MSSSTSSSSCVQGALVGSANLEALQKLGCIIPTSSVLIDNNISSANTTSSSSSSSNYLAEVFDASLERVLEEIATACSMSSAGGAGGSSNNATTTKRPALSLSLAKRRLKQQQQSSFSSEVSQRLHELSTSSRFDFYGSVENVGSSSGTGMGSVLSSVRKHMSSVTREATVAAWESLLQHSTTTTTTTPSITIGGVQPSSSSVAAEVTDTKPKRVLRLGASRVQQLSKGGAEKLEEGNDEGSVKRSDMVGNEEVAVKAEQDVLDVCSTHPLEPTTAPEHTATATDMTTISPTNGEAEEDTDIHSDDIAHNIKAEDMDDDKEEDLVKSVCATNITDGKAASATLVVAEEGEEEEAHAHQNDSAIGLNDDSTFDAEQHQKTEEDGVEYQQHLKEAAEVDGGMDTAALATRTEQQQHQQREADGEKQDEKEPGADDSNVVGTAKVVHAIISASIQMRSHARVEEDDDDLLNELLLDDEPVIHKNIKHAAESNADAEDEVGKEASHVVVSELSGKAEGTTVGEGMPTTAPPQLGDAEKEEEKDDTSTLAVADDVGNNNNTTSKAEVIPLPTPTPTPAPRSLFSKRTPIVPSSSAPAFPVVVVSNTATTTPTVSTATTTASMRCLQVLLQPLSFRWQLLLNYLQEAVFRKYSPDSTEYQLLWCLLPRLLETEIQEVLSKDIVPNCLGNCVLNGGGGGGGGGAPSSDCCTSTPSSSSTSFSPLLLSLLLRDIHTFSFTDIPPPALFQSTLDASTAEGLKLLLLSPQGGGVSTAATTTTTATATRVSSLLATTLTIQTVLLSPEELRSVVLRKSLQRLCDSICLSDLDHYHWFLNATMGSSVSGGKGSTTSSSSSPSTAQIAADHLRGIFLFPVTDDIAPGYSSKNRAPISLLEVHERIRRSLSSTITSPIITSTSSSSSYPPPHPQPSDISTLDELLDDISRISTNADAYHGAGTVLSRKASVLASSISKPSVRKRLTQYYLGDRWNRHLLEPLRKSLQTGWIANSETVSLFNNSMLLAIVEDYACGIQGSALWTAISNTIENNNPTNIDYTLLRCIGMPAGATLDTISSVPNPYVFIGGEPVHCGSAVSAIDQGGGVCDASLFPTFNTTATTSASSSESTKNTSIMILSQVSTILKRMKDMSTTATTTSTSQMPPSLSCGGSSSRLLSPIGRLFTKTVLSSLRGGGSAVVTEWKGLTVVSSRVGLVSYAGRLRGAPVPTTPSMQSDASPALVVGNSSNRPAHNSRANKEAAERFNKLAGSWDHRDVVRGDTTTSSVASSTPPGKSPVAKRMTRRSAGVVIDNQSQHDEPTAAVSGSKANARAPLTRRQMMAAAAAEEEEEQQQAVSGTGKRGGRKGTVVSSEVVAEAKKPEVVTKAPSSAANPLTKLMYWWAECSCGSWRLVSEAIKDAVGRGDLVDFKCKMVKKKCNTADDELPALGGGLRLLNVETKVVDDDPDSVCPVTTTSTSAPKQRGRKKKEVDASSEVTTKTTKAAKKAEEKAQKAADKKMLKKANKALLEEEGVKRSSRGSKSAAQSSSSTTRSESTKKSANTAAELLKADKKEKAEWKRNFKAAAAMSKQQQDQQEVDYGTTTAIAAPPQPNAAVYDRASEDDDDQMLLNLAPAVHTSSSAAAPSLDHYAAPKLQKPQKQQKSKKAVKSSRRAESSSSDSSSSSGSSTSSSSSSSSSSSGGSSGSSSSSSNVASRGRKGTMAPPRMSKPISSTAAKRNERNMMPPPPPPPSTAAGNKRVRGAGGAGAISPAVAGMLGGAGGLQHQVTGVNFHNAIKSISDSRKVQLYEEIKRALDELDQLTQQLSNLKQLPHALHHAIPQQLPPGKSVIEYLKTDVSGNHPAPPRPPSRSAPAVLAEYAAKLTWGSLQKEEARRVQVAQRTLIRKLQWCRTQLGLDKFDTQF